MRNLTKTIEITIPKGFFNVAITKTNNLIADTNDSQNWDTISFPLPPGNWNLKELNGKNVILYRHLERRTFFSKWW